ncbi:MAG: precorrin-6A reductase [Clostridia bacterium]|nr:precorrin-6A reductase [Clostridia bacterium]
MCKVILFGGTTEGNETAEFLSEKNIETLVCVATEYGATRMKEGPSLRISSERLDEAAMEVLIEEEKPEIVIDATHPYAKEVTANIKAACQAKGTEYMRLLRDAAGSGMEEAGAVFVDSVEAAAEYLSGTEGVIFASTGSKELHKYTAIPGYKERVVARVLSTADVAAECEALGFRGENLICMQGPFSKELNVAMLKAKKAKYLVTKVTGRAGGYEEKIEAANEAGCTCVIVGRPEEENGMSYYECKGRLCQLFDIKTNRAAALIGIGMGGYGSMTGEAEAAVAEAEIVIGARRMVESVDVLDKEVLVEYDSKKIAAYLEEHPEYEKIAVLLSGDTGFYSGAKKLAGALENIGCQVRQIAGISSVAYFMSKIKKSWDDAVIVSNHGREASLIPLIRDNEKVFSILGKKDDVAGLAGKLKYYGLDKVKLYVGEKLSYEDEKIVSGYGEDFENYENDPLCVVCAVNEDWENTRINKLARRRDEEFIRAKVPMTKFDVRSASIARMNLEEDSICYDIGSGTGSVSIEMAIIASRGHVYGVEKKEEAVALAEENKKKFMCDNFTIVPGVAPEAMEGLPAPSHVFIGGSSGNMEEIVAECCRRSSQAGGKTAGSAGTSEAAGEGGSVRFVINCIALESMAQALECSKKFGREGSVEISQVTSAEGHKVGPYTMMKGENPIYIVAFTGKELE